MKCDQIAQLFSEMCKCIMSLLFGLTYNPCKQGAQSEQMMTNLNTPEIRHRTTRSLAFR
jgi:hypothetical protein